MQLSSLLIALVTAVVVWVLLVRKLTAKPWAHAGEIGDVRDIGAVEHPPVRVGLWIFLCVISSLFALFITAYLMRMDPHHATDWYSVNKPSVLWLNTLFLVFSSLAMQWARSAEQMEQIYRLKTGLAAGGFFTLAFLGGQLFAWNQLYNSGYYDLANPAVGFFYLLTAVHGLHLVGGLWVWGGTTIRAWRTGKVGKGTLTVELCTVYWHYLLIVWLILFGLLLST